MTDQPVPIWGNFHDPNCPVTQYRKEVWETFIANINTNEREEWWGCVIEYTKGGDEEVEQCTCHIHREGKLAQEFKAQYEAEILKLRGEIQKASQRPAVPELLDHLPYLAKDALALALHMEVFNRDYTRHCNVVAGVEQGMIYPSDLDHIVKRLYELINLWDRG